MADNKNSFVLYAEYLELFEELNDEDAGQLVKHLFRYVNDKEPKTENPLVKLAFIPIKQALKRDLKKWETYQQKQRENGKKGGRPSKPKETQKTQPFISEPKKADNVNVNANVSVNDNKKNSKKSSRFSPPSLSEVEDYLKKEKSFHPAAAKKEAEKFKNYYESNGWMVGKNKMKKWKAAISNWISRMDHSNLATAKADLSPVMQKMKQYE